MRGRGPYTSRQRLGIRGAALNVKLLLGDYFQSASSPKPTHVEDTYSKVAGAVTL